SSDLHITSGYRISFTSTFYERAMHDSYILNSKLFFDANTVIQITKTHSSSDDFCRLIVERVRRFEKDVEMYALVAHHCIEELLIEGIRSEEHTSELQSRENLVCRALLENNND